jgi:hypothetical protein
MGHTLSSDSECEALDYDLLSKFRSPEYGRYSESTSDVEEPEEPVQVEPEESEEVTEEE